MTNFAHFHRWFDNQFPDAEVGLRDALIDHFNEDPEFWGNQSYWDLYYSLSAQKQVTPSK